MKKEIMEKLKGKEHHFLGNMIGKIGKFVSENPKLVSTALGAAKGGASSYMEARKKAAAAPTMKKGGRMKACKK